MGKKGPLGIIEWPFGQGEPSDEELRAVVTSVEGKALQQQIDNMGVRLQSSLNEVKDLTTRLNAATTKISSQAQNISSLTKQLNDAFARINTLDNSLKNFKGTQLSSGDVSTVRNILPLLNTTTERANLKYTLDNKSKFKYLVDSMGTSYRLKDKVESLVTPTLLWNKGSSKFLGLTEWTERRNKWNYAIDTALPSRLGNLEVWKGGINKSWVRGFVDQSFIKDRGFMPWSTMRAKFTNLDNVTAQLTSMKNNFIDFYDDWMEKSYSMKWETATAAEKLLGPDSYKVKQSGALRQTIRMIRAAIEASSRGQKKTSKLIIEDLALVYPKLYSGVKSLRVALTGTDSLGGSLQASNLMNTDLKKVKNLKL